MASPERYPDQEAGSGAWKSHYLLFSAALDVVCDRLERYYAARGVSLREMWILMSAGHKPSSQKDVAEELGINSNVMVGVVDGMEKKGLIGRTKNPRNRREYILSVTKKGRALLKWVDENYDDVAKEMWYPITSQELNGIREHAVSVLKEEAKRKIAETVLAERHHDKT